MSDKTVATVAQPYFVSVNEAAKFIRVSPKTMYKYIYQKIGPRVRYFGLGKRKIARIRYADLLLWADGRPSARKEKACL